MPPSHRRLAAVALLAAALLGWAAPPALPARAQSLQTLEQRIQQRKAELDKLNRQAQQLRNKLEQTQRKERATVSQLALLERKIARTEAELERARSDLAAARERLAATGQELARAERELARRSDYLGRRVRAIYEHGTVTYLDVLLAANSFADFLTRFDNLQRIVASDVRIFRRVTDYRDQVVALKAQQEAEKAQVENLVQQVQGTIVRLEQDKAAKEDYRQMLLNDIESLRRAYDELDRQSQQVTAELQKLEKELADRLRRTGAILLQKPLDGVLTITSPFGRRYHPILRQWRTHTGNDYAAGTGTPVKAAESGVVTHAGWLGGYGNAVIVMHGKGVSTLYAHLSKIEVTDRASVERGQVIGRVGSTGLSTGPHLHFEVRIDGEPRNPSDYLGRPIE